MTFDPKWVKDRINSPILIESEVAKAIPKVAESYRLSVIEWNKVEALVPGINASGSQGLLLALDNGNFAFAYPRTATSYPALAVLTPDGTVVNDIVLSTNAGQVPNFALLPNGFMIVGWGYDISNSASFAIFDQDGNQITSTFTPTFKGTSFIGASNIGVFPNGNFLIGDTDLISFNDFYYGIYAYNSDTTSIDVVVPEQKLDTVRDGAIDLTRGRAVPLPNGDMCLYGISLANTSVDFLVIDQFGNLKLDFLTIEATAGTAGHQVVFPNKNIFAPYSDASLDYLFQMFDSEFNQIVPETAIYTGNVSWLRSTLLPDGNLFTVFRDSSLGRGFYAILDQNGNILVPSTQHTSENTIATDAVVLSDGRVVVSYSTGTVAKFMIYKGKGTKINGHLQLESGDSVNEISNNIATDSTSAILTSEATQALIAGVEVPGLDQTGTDNSSWKINKDGSGPTLSAVGSNLVCNDGVFINQGGYTGIDTLTISSGNVTGITSSANKVRGEGIADDELISIDNPAGNGFDFLIFIGLDAKR